ncbi:peptidase M61 [Xanthocytophaga agilis]|uniref:Peptidase M61 n=1 Tax=Xanthocytophaga agilis TaxID=3048010 RepID=A0AAE3R912_9BACT|nr:peptidase M61 [Xanthocytophaga agilis]MDJ1505475.1 peptidase M61 [Xanthocytophaga agilis]
MKKILFSWVMSLTIVVTAWAVEPPKTPFYQFTIDLTKVKQDKVGVNLIVAPQTKKEVTYYLPKIVPGTYANYDFGRFVSEFQARDKQGKPLQIEKVDENSWKIKQANLLHRISYTVEDTWDTDLEGEFVFEPGGTNIEEEKNFVLNTHGFFGYLDDQKRVSYEVNVVKPAGFYGSTPLNTSKVTGNTDTYLLNSYNELVDSPMMYNKPDTTILKVGGADILISIYSPNKKVSAKEVGTNIGPMLEAQKQYLGGKLPIKKYAFLIYLFDKQPKSGKLGALEHSYSSLYCLPEYSAAELSQTIRDVASHEFFHILAPLSIHSEQIHYFDFNKPQMSKHLWLYEGMTEYFAGHMQVKEGLIDLPKYAEMIRDKFYAADQYNDSLPFTTMSKGCLDVYKDQYDNVYQKGALINLCLDIKLRQLSGGKYGVQNLMADLAKNYGKDKPFKDEELFSVITKLTYPEIETFFKRYVDGPERLPLEECFAAVGITYKANGGKVKTISLGNIEMGFNAATKRLVIASTAKMNDFGKKMGYQEKDEIVSINGNNVTIENVQQVFTEFREKTKEGDNLEMVVARQGADGKEQQVKLQGKVQSVEVEQKHLFEPMASPTAEQIALRKAWINQ